MVTPSTAGNNIELVLSAAKVVSGAVCINHTITLFLPTVRTQSENARARRKRTVSQTTTLRPRWSARPTQRPASTWTELGSGETSPPARPCPPSSCVNETTGTLGDQLTAWLVVAVADGVAVGCSAWSIRVRRTDVSTACQHCCNIPLSTHSWLACQTERLKPPGGLHARVHELEVSLPRCFIDPSRRHAGGNPPTTAPHS